MTPARSSSGPSPDVDWIEGLCRPEAYPHAVGEIRMLETHISWVVLTGEYAYKIKKPIQFNFVDYSTLAARRYFCHEELRLNRRTAPQLYLDVAPIAGSRVAPRIDGAGEPFEYAVRMRQFAQSCLLGEVLPTGTLTTRHFSDFGRQVAAFHASIADAPVPPGLGTPEQVVRSVQAVWDILTEHADASQRKLVVELAAWRNEREAALREAFAERRRSGFLRECHGDMHLGNLLLLDGRIVAFDGIEFNPALSWIDVMSEVAFLVMDLEAHRRRDAAFAFLNAYLEETGDYAGLAVMPYYLVYRAAVRAAVALLRIAQIADPVERAPHAAVAERYLHEAELFRHRPPPKLYITHGVSGSGKTYGSEALVEAEGMVRLRSDLERKRLAGLQATQRGGESLYSAERTDETYARLAELADVVLSAGFSVVVDATFLKRAPRQCFAELAQRRGVSFGILPYDAPESVLRERVAARMERGADASDADVAVLERQLASVEPLTDQERASCVSLP